MRSQCAQFFSFGCPKHPPAELFVFMMSASAGAVSEGREIPPLAHLDSNDYFMTRCSMCNNATYIALAYRSHPSERCERLCALCSSFENVRGAVGSQSPLIYNTAVRLLNELAALLHHIRGFGFQAGAASMEQWPPRVPQPPRVPPPLVPNPLSWSAQASVRRLLGLVCDGHHRRRARRPHRP